MNLNTFVINKPLSGSMLKSDGDIIFRIMDFKDPKNILPMFYRPQMKDGVIIVPPINSEEILR